jgi:hypothetical protein
MTIQCYLQGDDVHAVELHVSHPCIQYLLLRRDLKHLDLGVSSALMVKMNELRGPSMVSIDRTDSSVHHFLHGVDVSRITGGVRHNPLDRRLKVREELLGRLPLDAEHPPPGEKAHLGLGVWRGHPALVKDNVDFILCPLDVGVDGEAPGGSTKKRVKVACCYFLGGGESTLIGSSSLVVFALPFLKGAFVLVDAAFGMVVSFSSLASSSSTSSTSTSSPSFSAILQRGNSGGGGVRKHFIIIINWQNLPCCHG